MRGFGIVTFALALLVAPQAPATSGARASVSGRVIHAQTKEPLRGAIVTAARSSTGVVSAAPDAAFLTDANGAFVFGDVPSGSLNLTASKTGYLDAYLPAVVDARPGAAVDGILIALTPASSISGRVLDPAGDPVSGGSVRVVQRGESSSVPAARSASTDDRGVYVVDGLAAGDYLLGAERSVAHARTIPDARMVSAAIGTGEERHGMDLVVPWESGGTVSISASVGQEKPSVHEPAGTASIAGVVRTVFSRPLARVMVLAVSSEAATDPSRGGIIRGSTTDERGAFLIGGLPPGSFVVLALRAGIWAMAAGAMRPNAFGRPVQLLAGQQLRDVDIVLREPGSISGVVRDEFGDPVRASVSLIAESLPRGPAVMQTRTTDDLGRYRFGILPPGAYLVMATRSSASSLRVDDGAGNQQSIGPVPVLYPGVPTNSLASILTVDLGTELQGIDIVAGHVPVSRVELAINAPGLEVQSVTTRQFALGDAMPATGSNRGQEQRIYDAVAAGHWLFVAAASVATHRGTEKYWGFGEVTTDGLSPRTVELTLEPGARLSGRIVFDGDGPRPTSADIWLRHVATTTAGPVPLTPARVQVSPSGEFQIDDIMPGRYAIQAADRREDGAWSLRRATMRTEDVTDVPLDLGRGTVLAGIALTLTNRLTEISGLVTDGSGRPLAETEIVVASADARHHWPETRRIRRVVTAHDGGYAVRGLPPGEYVIGRRPAPAFGALIFAPEAMVATARVTLADGEKRVQNVTISR